MSEQHTYAGRTLAEIKAAAEAATPGPWQTGGDTVEQQGSGRIVYHVLTSEYCMERLESLDAIYGATANPATVLAMAARIEELERKTAAVDRIVSFLRDDAAAISYQSLWQYRTAALCVARQHPSVAIDAAMEQTKNREGI